MKPKIILLAALSLALLPAFISSAFAADAAQPSADALLKQMSEKIGGAQSYSFKATRMVSAAFAEAHNVKPKGKMEVKVKRPNTLAASARSQGDERYFYADGSKFTILDATNNVYAVAPMKASLDALPGMLATYYGFTPPLVDFVISDAYASMKWRAATISYGGKVTYHAGFLGLSQVECHRIVFTGSAADSELWLAVSDGLPRKMIVTMKGANAGMTLTIGFSDWKLPDSIPDQAFVFTPTAGAQKIPMVTTAEALKPKKVRH